MTKEPHAEPVPPPRRKFSRVLVTTYFAGGLALLLAGTVAVVYLALADYDRSATTDVTGRSPVVRTSREVPGSVEPSGPLLERIGPERLANGRTFVAEGERGAKFEVTVRALKFRRKGCTSFATKPQNGGYLPTELRVKVLSGEPAVTDYAFRFQQADGTRLNSGYGSQCEKDLGGFVRRLVAGRTYKTTIVFDVPDTRGDIVFVYPSIDVIATWHLR